MPSRAGKGMNRALRNVAFLSSGSAAEAVFPR